MRTHHTNHGQEDFEILRTPSGAIDVEAYRIRGQRAQARAIAGAFSWLNDRLHRRPRR